MAGSDYCFHTCLSVGPHFSKSSKIKQIYTVWVDMWIIDNSYLVITFLTRGIRVYLGSQFSDWMVPVV